MSSHCSPAKQMQLKLRFRHDSMVHLPCFSHQPCRYFLYLLSHYALGLQSESNGTCSIQLIIRHRSKVLQKLNITPPSPNLCLRKLTLLLKRLLSINDFGELRFVHRNPHTSRQIRLPRCRHTYIGVYSHVKAKGKGKLSPLSTYNLHIIYTYN